MNVDLYILKRVLSISVLLDEQMRKRLIPMNLHEHHPILVCHFRFVFILLEKNFLIIEYSYNPCRSFSQGSGCIGAAVCQG